MDHAEATDRMAEATAAPGGLTTLVADPSPDAVALREHIRGCDSCAAEWRAWSVVSLGLAAAVPDGMTMRPAARELILGAILARPRPALARSTPQWAAVPIAPIAAASMAPTASASSRPPTPVGQPSVVPGGRVGRATGMSSAASRAARRDPTAGRGGSWFRWLAVGGAAAVLLFVAGAAFGRPLGFGGEPARTGDVSRVLAVTAGILQGQGYSLAHLETPDGAPGGFVAISPGSGELVVVSEALAPPPQGVRYVCLLEREGTTTKVGYMKFDGTLAYWAGPVTDPVDLGLSGDRFVVQLETPGSEPALTGTF